MSPVAPFTSREYHRDAAKAAVSIYVAGMDPGPLAAEWRDVTRQVRKRILRTLIDTDYLRDIRHPLTKSGKHLLVLRHLFAPPISQDQLKLLLPLYPKGAEKKESKLSKAAADQFADAFEKRRDLSLTKWLETNSLPTKTQVRRLLHTVAPMISSQIFNTVRRIRLSNEQEKAVEELLLSKGWTKDISKLVSTPADLVGSHYMRNTKCKTRTSQKEVDIACGVSSSLILAMECKVSNDSTNSIKRVAEVMDKVKAWKDQWGAFIQTAAMLQGVVGPRQVDALLDSDVLVFWSHDLQPLSDWLDRKAGP